ncbi:class I ribonucleotide reductase maintenance protein YfaE [Aestuariibacter sp. AA17]|uniref:Class I ribonucleotide reductase maintenance protein YfaE n=1 Tax=Fluctibacter corallii TaxID=2984329 RepID=A0ABT3A5X8_9ALTE|nr:class I ribonucleotide reductase maintenance protein YfaE [Aestuariibacter sp. AA17]MCV2884059.1 class I ribonucleotide reductase maintenance protein YfaE [Aestuariibacter sp. AA17]
MSSDNQRFVIQVIDHKTFEATQEKTLLEHAEAHGVEIHYHCREGFCGACRTKLISGKVEYTVDPLAFIDDDEILPCCCKAKSDLILQIE